MEARETKKVMVTCYDSTFARLIALSGVVDYVLVGDSMGMVVYGESNTLQVSIRQMSEHTRAVKQGLSQAEKRPLLIVDMPVATYDSPEQAVEAGRILMASGAEMLKVEGPVVAQVATMTSEGMRVCGHIGLTPQSIQNYRVQGREVKEQQRLLQEAKDLEEAGCEMIVLEMIPAKLAEEITKSIKIPTIGIGAGPHCSGQVLVLYDLLGLNSNFKPKFLKSFMAGEEKVMESLKAYAGEVREQKYPDQDHSFW